MNKFIHNFLCFVASIFILNVESVKAQESEYGLNIINTGGENLTGYALKFEVGDPSNPLYSQEITVPPLQHSESKTIPLQGIEDYINSFHDGQQTSITLYNSHGERVGVDSYNMQKEHLRRFPVFQIEINPSQRVASISSRHDQAGLALLNAP